MIAQGKRQYRSPGTGPWAAAGWVASVVLATVVLTFAVPGPPQPSTDTVIELYASGLIIDEDGTRIPLPPDLEAPGQVAEAQLLWLAQGDLPGKGTRYESMAQQALLDLNALTLPVSPVSGTAEYPQRYALLAAWQDRWHYVWPRDASFAAAALAHTGHVKQAWGILALLQDIQSVDGTFEARYLPDTSGRTPDNRAPQLDGIGWVLWATQQLVSSAPVPLRSEIRAQLDPLISRATDAALRLTTQGSRLPPVSSDYWEVREYRVTLGTAAPLLSGLESAAALGRSDAQTAASRYRDLLTTTFGHQGYPRHRGWFGHWGATPSDTSVNFVRRPFVSDDLSGAADAWQDSQSKMSRPAGGLAPGGSWRNDGISWTPTTSIYALVAACTGDVAEAERRLDWLSAHRTVAGSLPEKVLSDGSPAAVAPLAWTSANTLLALRCLES